MKPAKQPKRAVAGAAGVPLEERVATLERIVLRLVEGAEEPDTLAAGYQRFRARLEEER